jgi:peptidyl-dipeptidase Dcp
MREFIVKRILIAAAVLLPAANFININNNVQAFEMNNQFFEKPAEANPLLPDWTGPYSGVPPFDKVKVEHFKPALEAAMAENLAEIDKIAANKSAPTFDNTIAEMERAGKALSRVGIIYSIYAGTMSSPEMRAVEREMGPKFAAMNDRITQNEALFKRIETVYNSPEKSKLSPEQQRLTWRYYTNFVRAGAKLVAAEKKRLSEINQTLAGLYTKFSQNLLADETEKFLVLKSEADLAGLPQSVKDAAAQIAASKNLKGSWVIANTRSSVDPFLTYSDRRDLREKVWKMFVNRGDNADKNDNNAIIPEILQLRAERARIGVWKTRWRKRPNARCI